MQRTGRWTWITAAMLGVLASGGFAVGSPAGPTPGFPPLPHIAILQADKAPVVDGALDDACWAKAEESSAMTDEYSFPVKLKTTFQVAQKDDVLYLAIRARYDEKTPQQTGKGATRNRSLWDEEVVEVFLDPDNEDTPGYYQMVVTPFDVTGDFYNNEPRDTEKRWNPKYQVKSRWSTNEWTIEYGIPLAAFDRTPTVYENFGLNVHRVDVGYWGVATWSPLHSENLHFPHRFGEARGLKGASVKTNAPGRVRMPQLRVNDRVIRAKASPSLVPEQTPALVGKPEVKAGGKDLDIRFEVNTRTDVAVWIEDAKGERVRHLVAGMLGSNPPPPLAKDTLRQTLKWDYLDDYGKKVPAGAYKVKVGVGSQATLDKEIGRDESPREIHGLTVDQKGAIYTIGGGLDIRKYDRAGKFISMLMPPPADVPIEKLVGLNIIDYGLDGQVRFGSHHRLASTMPHLDQLMPHTLLVNGKGQIIFIGGENPGGPARLYKINGDGSLPEDFIGPRIVDWNWMTWWDLHAKRFHFALDPRDGETVYVSGLKDIHRRDMGGREDNPELVHGSHETFFNAVFRVRWAPDAPLEVFAGKPNTHGTEGSDKPGEFFDPQGIAFDNDGNLWVCDRRNDRIQVLDHEGKFLRQIPHTEPYQVCISRKTGQSYVMGIVGDNPYVYVATITKYAAGPAPAALASMSLPGAWTYWQTTTLDESAKRPELVMVWSPMPMTAHGSGPNRSAEAYRVLRIEDQGAQFGEPQLLLGQVPPRGCPRSVSWDTDILPTGDGYLDANTGRFVSAGAGERVGGESLAARDGRWVVRDSNDNLHVYPEAWGTNPAAKALFGWSLTPISLREHDLGFAVAPNSDVYVARYYNLMKMYPGMGNEDPGHHIAIDRYSIEGKLIERRVVYELSPGANAPVVDIHGNIYVCDNFGRRIGQFYEDDIAANLPSWAPDYHIGAAEWDQLRAGKKIEAGYHKFVINPLIRTVGAVYKFSPKGGGILWRAAQAQYTPEYVEHQPQTNKAGQVLYPDWGYPFKPLPKRPATHWSSAVTVKYSSSEHGMYPCWTEGVEWEFLGVSPAPGRYSKVRESGLYGSLRFCADDFGRLYVPAAHRNTVRMIDTVGNELLRIGRYGNLDSGPNARLKEPGIPLWSPQSTTLSKRYLYITDQRLLRVRMGYVQELATEVKVP